jgi:hypothetical protein
VLNIERHSLALMFFKDLPRTSHLVLLFLFCRERKIIGRRGSGVPRTVPAAARAGKKYFVKAIAVASPMIKKDLRWC